MTDLSTGKSVLVLATVIGCFAILWPRIFYPMMQATFSLASPTGSQDQDDSERPKPARVRGHPPGHPTQAGRIPARMQEIIGEGRPDIDPLTTITLEDGRPFTRPGVRGPSNRPQQKTGGTMSIVMPVYTIGIVGFFLYTILKLVFKNKNENEEDPEIDQKGYSNTMRKLGVDPSKLSKLRECVYNSGQSCQDIDEYAELLHAQNRQDQRQKVHKKKMETKQAKMTRSDLLGKTKVEVKPTKKNPFQGMKKQEVDEIGSDEEEVYQNLWEAEERVKELLAEVEKRRIDLTKNHKHQQQSKRSADQMRDVQQELQQRLQTMAPEEAMNKKNDLGNKPRAQIEDIDESQKADDSTATDDAKPRFEDASGSGEDSSNDEMSEDDGRDSEEDQWEDQEERTSDEDVESETVDDIRPANEDDKILQILDLLIRDKVQNGGEESQTTKTILRLRKELDEKRASSGLENGTKKNR